MTVTNAYWIEQVQHAGFAVLRGIYSAAQVDIILNKLGTALTQTLENTATLVGSVGKIYAARNLLTL